MSAALDFGEALFEGGVADETGDGAIDGATSDGGT